MGMTVTKDLRKLKRLINSAPNELDDFMRGVAIDFTSDVQLSLGTGPAGETVTRYNPRRTHTVSVPGFPPNTDIGNLIGDMTWERLGKFRYRYISGAEYSEALEDVHNRPFVAPVLFEWQQKITSELKNAGIIE